MVRGKGHVDGLGLADGLAVVQGLHLGQKVGVRIDDVGDLEQDARALGRLGRLPGGKGGPGCADGGIDVLLGGLGAASQAAACRGVDGVKRGPVGCGGETAVDVEAVGFVELDCHGLPSERVLAYLSSCGGSDMLGLETRPHVAGTTAPPHDIFFGSVRCASSGVPMYRQTLRPWSGRAVDVPAKHVCQQVYRTGHATGIDAGVVDDDAVRVAR